MSTSRHSLVLIPGLLCDATVWPHQRAALADIADVQVSDPGTLDSLPAMARAILAKAPPRFAIAGHSMGGRIAFEVYRAAPERVSGVALLDTGFSPLAPGTDGEREVAGRFALLETARRDGMRAMAQEWVRGMVHPARLTDRALVDAILDMFASKAPEIYAAQTRALIDRPDAEPVMRAIRAPALVLCGHEDSWSPVQRHREMSAAIPGSRFVDVPQCGHMCTMERPDAVSNAIRAWFLSVISAEEGRDRLDAKVLQPVGAARAGK
ncbi:MAG: alpha/beta fold hydrolase [Gammaproteobacteria bacterium]